MAAAAAEEQSKNKQLHALFFPLMAHGHMLPLFDVACLFAARGVRTTIVTTQLNAPVFAQALNTQHKGLDVHLEIIRFPSEKVGLPAGLEDFDDVLGDDVLDKFLAGIRLLRGPLEEVMRRLQPPPDCIVSDNLLPWTAEVAAEHGIPRLVFYGTGFIGISVTLALLENKPEFTAEDEEYVVPGLPGEIRLTRSRLPPEEMDLKKEGTNPMAKMFEGVFEAKSFGATMNSFHDLEEEYEDYYRKVLGRRAWSVGPVSFVNRRMEDKAKRGKKCAIDEEECKRWLDSKPPNSVIYISFGSTTDICCAQMREIAMAIESLDQNFVWVVRTPIDATTDTEKDWLPSGFKARNQDKVLIIEGWAPQVMILDHEATGVFITHCGWNSTLEGILAGVSMVTWLVHSEQFINEKLIIDVLKVGVPSGASKYWNFVVEKVTVGKVALEAAIRGVIAGKEAEEIRVRALRLREMAWKAVEEGGSSFEELSDLLNELSFIKLAMIISGTREVVGIFFPFEGYLALFIVIIDGPNTNIS